MFIIIIIIIIIKQSMDCCKLRTSGVWGEASAANDVGAFWNLLVQLKSACNVGRARGQAKLG